MTVVLSASGLNAGYDGHPVVRDVDIEVNAGEVVAVVGANGAGKTTTLMTLAGVIPAIGGEVTLFGAPTRAPLHRRAKQGLSLVTEERSVFMSLTVAENLRVARCAPERALELFPELQPLVRRTAGLLSGGEQQMLTLARAIARQPRLLLADELSLGLAPLVVQRLLQAVRAAADINGIGVLLVEQHVNQALRYADRVYAMRRGRVVLQGAAAEVGARLRDLEGLYLSADDDSEAATTEA
jgi:branched-chain amino acid transport system ATP-binding protein